MENMEKSTKCVLISMVKNFLEDHIGNEKASLEEKIDEFIKFFRVSSRGRTAKLPDTKFGILMPLGRPALDWYQSRIDSIKEFMSEGLSCHDMMKDNVLQVCPVMT
jgi:hypothetical protein